MNTILVLGLYAAAISRELGIALRFPGALGHLKDACDAQLLAKAVHWAGSDTKANNEIFNVSNGDCFVWEQVFPKIAEVFNMECATPHSMSLARVMADKGPVWDKIVAKYNLKPIATMSWLNRGNMRTSRSAIVSNRFNHYRARSRSGGPDSTTASTPSRCSLRNCGNFSRTASFRRKVSHGSISARPVHTLPSAAPSNSLAHNRRIAVDTVACCVPAFISRKQRCSALSRSAMPPP